MSGLPPASLTPWLLGIGLLMMAPLVLFGVGGILRPALFGSESRAEVGHSSRCRGCGHSLKRADLLCLDCGLWRRAWIAVPLLAYLLLRWAAGRPKVRASVRWGCYALILALLLQFSGCR